MYNQQKQFVENASHELQTPLAICMNKLELLSEDPDCTEEQLSEIAEEYSGCRFRLSITGSAGLGLANASGLPFVQEVFGAFIAVKKQLS